MHRLRELNVIDEKFDDEEIFLNYKTACSTGISKVMAKMGISTLHSYKVWFCYFFTS